MADGAALAEVARVSAGWSTGTGRRRCDPTEPRAAARRAVDREPVALRGRPRGQIGAPSPVSSLAPSADARAR